MQRKDLLDISSRSPRTFEGSFSEYGSLSSQAQVRSSVPIESKNSLTRFGAGGSIALCFLALAISLALAVTLFRINNTHNTPSIGNVTFDSNTVARYDAIRIQFDVETVASDLDLPFDSSPPPGLQPSTGVTVDALLSNDKGKTTIVQPAFLYQPYTTTIRDGRDHLTPSGPPRWTVRFTPQQAGDWELRLRGKDASGEIIYPPLSSPALSFEVDGESGDQYRRHGFLQVSKADPRYFEFQDGTPFVGVGFNDTWAATNGNAKKLAAYEDNKINFLRIWLSGSGINGSQWTSWGSPFIPYDGYIPGVSLDTKHTFGGAGVSLKLDSKNPCLFANPWRGGIPVEPDTRYDLSARLELASLKATALSDLPGFVIKQAAWLDKKCVDSNGTLITTPLLGTTDWITATGAITTGPNQYWLDYIYLARQNVQSGQVYIDSVDLWKTNDPARVNLLHQPLADATRDFDSMSAAQWDDYIEQAGSHGVYMKLVIDEKGEWIRNHITATGVMTDAGGNNNFYAAPNTKVRWLDQAWWRYIIARWGYSTAIHSFEFVNEGDPFNGNHYEAANAFANYIHQNDPSRHMVTTSFWHSFPNKQFWSNPQYPDIDYADLHAYISTGWGTSAAFMDLGRIVKHPSPLFSGNAVHIGAKDNINIPFTPLGLVVRGPGEWIIKYWMKANAYVADCPLNSSGGMQRVDWEIDGGNYNHGKQGIVPYNQEQKDFVCASPAGSFDWRQFQSDKDRNGKLLPAAARLVLTDDKPHEITLRINNSHGSSGEAWIGDVELVSPSGQVVPVIGQFDSTPLNEDTAWFNRAYGDIYGGKSPVGARMPLVRGETGIDIPGTSSWDPAIISDTNGIWLHNNVWGQINSGGMYDLMWWSETIPEKVYPIYEIYRNFMDGIPLNNGNYKDLGARTSDLDLRAWGQRDDKNGRMHLWIQNIMHTWKRVVSNRPIEPVAGLVVVPKVTSGKYCVSWWNTYDVNDPVSLTQVISATDSLTLTLPFPLQDDVGAHVRRITENEPCLPSN